MPDYNTLDLIILFFIIVGALFGIYKGFVYSLLNFAGKVLSAILAHHFLGSFIDFFKIKEIFLKGLMKIVEGYIPLSEGIKGIKIENGYLDLTGTLIEKNLFAKIMGGNISREIERLYDIAHVYALQNIGEMMSLIVSNYIINILSFIALFLLFLFGFSFLRMALIKLIGTSIFVTWLDKGLGFVFGAGINIIILAFVVGVSFDILNLLFLKSSGMLSAYRSLINESYLKEYLYYIYSLVINEGIKLL